MTADGGRPIRVLHVEDEPDFADLAATMLERAGPSIEVRTAEDAAEALSVLADADVDCVVSDFDMPGTDGLEFLEAVRERHGDLPFVLFTGKGSEEIASEAISAGVTDYIQKGGGREQYAMLANRIENAVERHRTEAALREERRRFELVGRASADAFWDLDLRTGEVERSEGYERIYGFDADEVGDDLEWWIQQVHPDDREKVRRATREAIEGGDETIEVDYRVEAADGSYKDAYTRAHVVREDGEPVRVVGAVTDVTDLRERERELERVRERLELALEGTETGVWEWNPETDEVYWDETVEHIFGVPPGGFEGTFEAVQRRIHDDDRERVEAALERALADQERYDEEFRIRRDDGALRWVHAKGVRSVPDDGAERFVGLISDVTGRKDRERELRQYETILESVPDGVFVLDEEGLVEAGNEAAAAMLGFEYGELVGTEFGSLIESGVVDASIVDRYGDAVRSLLTSETDDEEARFEFEATVDGEERVFEGRISLRPHDEAFRGTIGIVQDVTGRKEREERLRRSERRFEAVFDDPSAFIGLLDPDGTLLKVNETALEFVGATLEEVRGRQFLDTPWWDDEPPEKRAEIEAGIERAAGGEFVRFEARHSGVEGETIDVEGHVRPVTDESGDVVSLLVEGFDVTDRREHERTVLALLETARELVRAVDPEEVADVVVRAATEILEQPSAVVRLRDGDVLRPVAVSEEAREQLGERPVYRVDEGFPGRVLAEGEPLIVDEEDDGGSGLHPSRLYLPIGEHGTLSIGEDEEDAFDESDVALTEMLTNNAAVVLDRIQGEQKLRERELSLSRQNERLDRFARIVSHDLRNPLNVAKGGVDLIEEDTGSEHVGMVESALDRMDDIIDDALSLARQGQAVVDPDPVDLEAAVGSAWATVAAEEATLEVVDRLGTCLADESRLRQLLENLFQNAVEHGGSDVTVEVGTVADGGAVGAADDGEVGPIEDLGVRVGFYVADDGPGIPASEREDVFEFGWSHADGGTGFGLAIVEEIAEAHGWSVEATESASGGARFEVTGVEGTDADELDAGFEEA